MTLTQFAHLVGVDAKWVLNAAAALGLRRPYSLELAREMTMARVIHDDLGVPIGRAMAFSRDALRQFNGERSPVSVTTGRDGDVALTVDVYRALASLYVRLANVRTSYEQRARGRPVTRHRDPIEHAREWGIDVSLLQHNLALTQEQRIRQLDSMAAFSRDVQRLSVER